MPTPKKRKQQPVKNAAKVTKRTQATVPKPSAKPGPATPEAAKGKLPPCDHDDCQRTRFNRTGAPSPSTGHAPAREADTSPDDYAKYGPAKAAPMTDEEAVAAYLDDLAKYGQYMRAAEATGHPYKWIQRRRKADPVFAAAEAEALSSAPDYVRSEIARRAVQGVTVTMMSKYGPYDRVDHDNALLLRYAEYLETGTWKQRTQVETGAPGAFKTRAELQTAIDTREAEMAKARIEMAAEDARESGLDADAETAPKTEG